MKLAISYSEMVKEFLGKVEGSIKIPKDVQGTELRIKKENGTVFKFDSHCGFNRATTTWLYHISKENILSCFIM